MAWERGGGREGGGEGRERGRKEGEGGKRECKRGKERDEGEASREIKVGKVSRENNR